MTQAVYTGTLWRHSQAGRDAKKMRRQCACSGMAFSCPSLADNPTSCHFFLSYSLLIKLANALFSVTTRPSLSASLAYRLAQDVPVQLFQLRLPV